jgi:ABC-type nickel/cobalt efflux system permease component RcnA
MVDLQGALASGNIMLMAWVAAALGCIHTVLGPDHYVPFVMMAKAEKWSRTMTAVVTFLCGLGHVGSSVAIGAGLAAAGTAVAAWSGSRWEALQEWRGSLSAWLLIGAGAAFFVWGIVRAKRNRPHTHAHVHEDGTVHAHSHAHRDDHMHPHAIKDKDRSITPWVLFTIFIFGPCESLVPLMLAAWAAGGLGATVLVAAAFSITTVATIMAVVGVLLLGVSRIPLGKLDRYSLAAAGVALVLCGVAIRFAGL